MKARGCTILLASVICAAVFGGRLAAPAWAGYEFPVCADPGPQEVPAISGTLAVWQDYSSGNWDIYGKNLSTGVEFPICTAPGNQSGPRISGNIVVWTDLRNDPGDGSHICIYGKDLSTGVEFPVCTSPGNHGGPSISGHVVVWTDDRNPTDDVDIYGKDLSTGTEFPICTAPGAQAAPDISGNIVVWADFRNVATSAADIYGKNLSTGEEFPVCTAPGGQGNVAISGHVVVWEDGRNEATTGSDIYGKDLATGEEFPVCTAPGGQDYPAVSGHLAVWFDTRNVSWDIYGRDLSTGVEFPLCTEAAPQIWPAISGSIVVWEERRNALPPSYMNCDIYGYAMPTFADVPITYWAYLYVEAIYDTGITAGCSVTPRLYCPSGLVTRGQMAIFLIRGMPQTPCSSYHHYFTDVPQSHPWWPWIERLYELGLTAGCGGTTPGVNLQYCVNANVTRGQMAIFLIRAMEETPGASYHGYFTDVPQSNSWWPWIERLYELGITSGCGGTPGNLQYCPSTSTPRDQMAVFLTRAFNLPLGP